MCLRSIRCLTWLVTGLAAVIPTVAAEPDFEFFEAKIRPVLIEHCYECHSAQGESEGGLLLDSRDGLRTGGDSGPALFPEDAAASLILKALRYDGDLQMPPEGKLSDTIIADFERWISTGAADPRDDAISMALKSESAWEEEFATRKKHWSLQPLLQVLPPHAADAGWNANPVDAFIAAEHQVQGLIPAEAADKRTLLRRVTYALTGLPPSPAEIDAFLADDQPDAFERVVDRLLASPRFGERFATHWLDLVRYAETHGSEGDPPIPFAWRYRDYVIRALDADVPYDQFVREQIAGDLLDNPRIDAVSGINESAIGPAQFRLVEHGFQPVDSLDEQAKTIDNQIDVVSKAFQGLTIACARCHDHKFDAISQKDYYALYGVLARSRPAQVTINPPKRLQQGLAELASLKRELKAALAEAWLDAASEIPDRLLQSLEKPQRSTDEERLAELDRLALAALDGERGAAESFGPVPRPMAAWTFSEDGRDVIGELDLKLVGGATINNGRLVLDGQGAFARSAPLQRHVREKTLEAWVAVSHLEQQGSGVITLQNNSGDVFDSIVFGELQSRHWAAGSEFLRRSKPVGGVAETGEASLVHLAAVYAADGSIQLFREGQPYGQRYQPESAGAGSIVFQAGDSRVLFGMRHADRGPLAGEIEEARLYDRALTEQEVLDSFRRGLGLPSEDMLANALPETLRAERHQLRQGLNASRTSRGDAALDPWIQALEAAKTDRRHPLHLWAKNREESPTDLAAVWNAEATHWQSEIEQYAAVNGDQLQQLWDLTKPEVLAPWSRHGSGLASSSPAGEFAIEPSGESLVTGIYPSGVYTHRLSQKQNGLLTSSSFKLPKTLWVRMTGDHGGGVRVMVDGYPLGANDTYPQSRPAGGPLAWVKLDTTYREGSSAYLEFATFDDLTREATAKGGGKAIEGRSYFGVAAVMATDGNAVPLEPLPILPLLKGTPPGSAAELAILYATTLTSAIITWRDGTLTDDEALLLDAFVRSRLLPNTLGRLPKVAPLVEQYRRVEAGLPVPERAPGVLESAGFDAPLFVRGNPHNAGPSVPRGYPVVLGGRNYESAGSGRLELAADLSSPTNPMTSRVAVNRLWSWLFGRGLVATPDNFGLLGEPPTHPELLDYLARRFIQDEWSTKQMVRLIVTSQTYRLSSIATGDAANRDPANEWLSRFPIRRLDAESIRDGVLAMSGELDSRRFGAGVTAGDLDAGRRSVYLAVRRTNPHAFLEVFDKPAPMSTRGRRDVTTLPAQSLTLLNSDFINEVATRWGARLAAEDITIAGRIDSIFEAALGRLPADAERQRSLAYLTAIASDRGLAPESMASDARIWRDFVHSVLCFKETIYLR